MNPLLNAVYLDALRDAAEAERARRTRARPDSPRGGRRRFSFRFRRSRSLRLPAAHDSAGRCVQ
jgi:hypothetical protein